MALKKTILIDFHYGRDESLIIEVGHLYARFYYKDGLVYHSGSPYEVALPYLEEDLSGLSWAINNNEISLFHVKYKPAVLYRQSNDNWEYYERSFSPEPTFENGEYPTTTVTPSATTGNSVTFTASTSLFLKSDIGRRIIHKAGKGIASIISMVGSGVDTVTATILENFPSTSAIAIGNWYLDLSPNCGLVSDKIYVGEIAEIKSEEYDAATNVDAFRTSDVGKYIKFNSGILKIVERVNAYTVKCIILKSLTAKTKSGIWTLEEASWSSSRGYPRAGCYHEARLALGGTKAEPNAWWASDLGIYDSIAVGTNDSDAISDSITGTGEITWMLSANNLIIGTTLGETAFVQNGPLSTTNLGYRRTTSYGSVPQMPIKTGNEVLFIDSSARKLYSYSDIGDNYNYSGNDLFLFSNHLTRPFIKKVAYSKNPNSNIYCLLEDGTVLISAYAKQQEVLGWSRMQTNGFVSDVAIINYSGQDQVYFIIDREIEGQTKRYIEVIKSYDEYDWTNSYLDSSQVYSEPNYIENITKSSLPTVTANAHGFSNGDRVKFIKVKGMVEINNLTSTISNVTTNTFKLTQINTTSFSDYVTSPQKGEVHKLVSTITGLDHLEGIAVQVLADGAVHPDREVTGGQITLQEPHIVLVIGERISARLKTLPKEYDIGLGSMQSQMTRWRTPTLRVNDSVKPILNGNRPGYFVAHMDAAPGLFTGDIYYDGTDWEGFGMLDIESEEPLPCNLVGIFGEIEGNIK